MLTIIDGNNWFRRRAERDQTGSPLRQCYIELQTMLVKGPVVIVWDGFNGNAQRRKIFPDYKLKRTPAAESMYESQKLMKKLLTFSKALTIEVPGFEGDDVIAAVVNRYRGLVDMLIESNDMDLRQLNVPMSRKEFPVEPERITLYKTMVGDPSDNIKGCVGFGETAWSKLTPEQMNLIESIILSGWGKTANEVKAEVESFFSPKALKWFCDPVNRDLLKVYYRIINFIPVPWELCEQHSTKGKNKPDVIEKILKEYML